MYITEEYKLTLDNNEVKVIHKGHKSLKDQGNALNDLREMIEKCIDTDEETQGFIPYNNFECSVDWKII
mgnify:CR=1 FL=1|tara:strand:+ start:881 stop:1087 length:207 start_codon:yes stop_codon:yes gene_type:complete